MSTRTALLDAARAEFAARGFRDATLRSIAARAGADPAMINYWFGGKQDLFAAVLELPVDLRELRGRILAGPRHQVGTRLLSAYLQVWDNHPAQLTTMVRSTIATNEGADTLRHFLTHVLLRPLIATLDVDQPELRAGLCATQMIGLSVGRFALRLPSLADADPAVLVDTIGPTLQRYLTGALPPRSEMAM